ncbi:hypothetical protein SALBM217S_09380 [Streptomyces griseoloalbus]
MLAALPSRALPRTNSGRPRPVIPGSPDGNRTPHGQPLIARAAALHRLRTRKHSRSHVSRKVTAPSAPLHQFTALSATRRGARLARLLAVEQLRGVGTAARPGSVDRRRTRGDSAVHGRVQGRVSGSALSLVEPATLRIEVTDTRGDHLPMQARSAGDEPAESGYGLLLVEELADRWGVREGPAPCKTVWAELDLGQ